PLLSLWDTFCSKDFRSIPDCRSLLVGNSRPFHGYLGVLFEHRNVGHRQKRDPALPVLSKRPVLSSKRVSQFSSPDSFVEPYDMGYSGIPATVAYCFCTGSCGRFPRVDIDPCWTLTGLCVARSSLLHLVVEILAWLTSLSAGG